MSNFLVNNRSIAALILLAIVGFPTVSFSQTNPVHTILAVKGKVTLKKTQWNKHKAAFTSLSVSSSDRLDVPANASITVYCSNLTQYTFKPGKHTVSGGCPVGKSVVPLLFSNNQTLLIGRLPKGALDRHRFRRKLSQLKNNFTTDRQTQHRRK